MSILKNYYFFVILYIMFPLISYSFSSSLNKIDKRKSQWMYFIFIPAYLWFLTVANSLIELKTPILIARIASFFICLCWCILFTGLLGTFAAGPSYCHLISLAVWFYYPAILAIALFFKSIKN